MMASCGRPFFCRGDIMEDWSELRAALVPQLCRCGTVVSPETPCATIPQKLWSEPGEKQEAFRAHYLALVIKGAYCGRVLADHRAAEMWRARTVSPQPSAGPAPERAWETYLDEPPPKRLCVQLNQESV